MSGTPERYGTLLEKSVLQGLLGRNFVWRRSVAFRVPAVFIHLSTNQPLSNKKITSNIIKYNNNCMNIYLYKEVARWHAVARFFKSRS